MCRQFYRHCRDCHELFPMSEPDMRDTCKEFRKARAIDPHIQDCPSGEVPVLRRPSGHGGRLCETCRTRNGIERRKRENAQKRARRAKSKRDRMTAGMGTGNVVWTPPSTWTASVLDAQTLALHSPPAQRKGRRFNTSNVQSIARQLQYGPYGSTNTVVTAQSHANVSQQDRELYSHSRQVFETNLFNGPQSQENGRERTMREDINLHHHYKREPQYLPTMSSDILIHPQPKRQRLGLGIAVGNDDINHQYEREPQYPPTMSSDILVHPQPKHERLGLGIAIANDDINSHQQCKHEPQHLQTVSSDILVHPQPKHQRLGLGIAFGNDAKWEQSYTETCSVSLRMELREWSTIFEDDDDPQGSKEI